MRRTSLHTEEKFSIDEEFKSRNTDKCTPEEKFVWASVWEVGFFSFYSAELGIVVGRNVKDEFVLRNPSRYLFSAFLCE